MTARPKSVQNSVCLNHPDRAANARCDVCFKPICAQCAIDTQQGTFCSQTCVNNFVGTEDSVGQWQAQQSRMKARRWRRRFIMLIILAGLGWAAHWYFTRHPSRLDDLKRKADGAVRNVKGRLPR